ncbi:MULTISPECIES: hypothetical protein [unclassified Brevibacterium]|uniref:hypothetical protein n=1 Tax=unclassified Brevibacterium TaxID=2614124 RepID=UPI0008A40AA9|nr:MULTISPECIES: hypothetical protein [unclassified Brevibacterium]OFL67256.1 hypothetical protein HMPREF2757_11185 [Brevibacterium sp. HMSC063G07]OFS26032.1 hypothetical protein HMPREF3162_07135 [Brevibacterium sp. HMSC07C04]
MAQAGKTRSRRASRARKGGRGPISKRWIYWKRRYSNPVRRDWVLLYTLIGIALSCAGALVNVRVGGIMLAATIGAVGLLRIIPSSWQKTWVNRSAVTDAATTLLAAALLVFLALTLPSA